MNKPHWRTLKGEQARQLTASWSTKKTCLVCERAFISCCANNGRGLAHLSEPHAFNRRAAGRVARQKTKPPVEACGRTHGTDQH